MTTETIKVWYLSPNSKSVNVIKIPKKFTYENDIYPLLKCSNVEYQGYTNEKGDKYAILMNELGLYEDTEYNEVAHKILGKIKLSWGGNFNGRYVIYKWRHTNDESDEEENLDMDLTIKEFINQFNSGILRSIKARQKFYNQLLSR